MTNQTETLAEVLQMATYNDRIVAALETTGENLTAWRAQAFDHASTPEFKERQTKLGITHRQVASLIIETARAGLTPGLNCAFVMYGGNVPKVQLQILVKGIRELASRVPGFMLGKPTVIHRNDQWEEARLQDTPQGHTLAPYLQLAPPEERVFAAKDDVVAVIGAVQEGGLRDIFTVNLRDLTASWSAIKNDKPGTSKYGHYDVEAWGRVVWLRRAYEHYGVMERARRALSLDSLALEGDDDQPPAPAAQPAPEGEALPPATNPPATNPPPAEQEPPPAHQQPTPAQAAQAAQQPPPANPPPAQQQPPQAPADVNATLADLP